MAERSHDPAPPAHVARRRYGAGRVLFSAVALAAAFYGMDAAAQRAERSSYCRMALGTSAEKVAAIQALADGARPDAAGRVAAALGDTDASVRRAAVAALEDLRSRDWRWKIVWLAVNDPDAGVRARACGWCGQFGDDKCVEPLARALGDAESSVRAEAAAALGALRAVKKREPVLRLALDPLQPENVRNEAVRALGRIGSRSDAMHLALLLRDDPAVDRTLVAESLARITGVEKGLDSKAWLEYLEKLEDGGEL